MLNLSPEQLAEITNQFNSERINQINELHSALFKTVSANCAMLSIQEIIGVLEQVKYDIIYEHRTSNNADN